MFANLWDDAFIIFYQSISWSQISSNFHWFIISPGQVLGCSPSSSISLGQEPAEDLSEEAQTMLTGGVVSCQFLPVSAVRAKLLGEATQWPKKVASLAVSFWQVSNAEFSSDQGINMLSQQWHFFFKWIVAIIKPRCMQVVGLIVRGPKQEMPSDEFQEVGVIWYKYGLVDVFW